MLVYFFVGMLCRHHAIDQLKHVIGGDRAFIILAHAKIIRQQIALAYQMQVAAAVLIIHDIIDGETVDAAAELLVVLAYAFKNTLDLAVILREQDRDTARFPEIKGL